MRAPAQPGIHTTGRVSNGELKPDSDTRVGHNTAPGVAAQDTVVALEMGASGECREMGENMAVLAMTVVQMAGIFQGMAVQRMEVPGCS